MSLKRTAARDFRSPAENHSLAKKNLPARFLTALPDSRRRFREEKRNDLSQGSRKKKDLAAILKIFESRFCQLARPAPQQAKSLIAEISPLQ